MCIRDSRGKIAAVTVVFNRAGAAEVAQYGIYRIPVSYTHLDVYKRQRRSKGEYYGNKSCAFGHYCRKHRFC